LRTVVRRSIIFDIARFALFVGAQFASVKEIRKMKVILVNGSSHANGTTMRAIAEMEKTFASGGIETQVIQLGGSPVRDCIQCNSCRKTGECVFKDDGVNDFVRAASSADGFVFATPVYYAHASGRLLSFLDRAFYSSAGYKEFKFKPGAAVAVLRRAGATAAIDDITKYFGIAQMPVPGSTYWNTVYGIDAEEAEVDAEGLETLRNLASNMIWMMRCFKAGRDAGVELPKTEKTAVTGFIRR
jgi:hypothetical protein